MSQPQNLQTRQLNPSHKNISDTLKDQYTGEIGAGTKIALVVRKVRVKIILQVIDSIVIGRSFTENDTKPFIDLHPFDAEELGVSRKHLRLWSQNQELFIEDLASTNGSFLNGKQLLKNVPQRIHHGDQIRLGGLELEIEIIADMLS